MTASLTLDALRSCLEGVVPSIIATCAVDGTPNVTYVSQVHYVDSRHLALSFQFFNKTRENILVNPYASVNVVNPDNAAHYRLQVKYLRTETEGALFENMKAKLAGIASHTGMSKVFRLRGSDIYELLSIEALPCPALTCEQPANSYLPALRSVSQRLSASHDLNSMFETLLQGLQEDFDIHHAMVLMADQHSQRLYTVASNGYAASGVGAEIPFGAGIIGVAAREHTSIRSMYMTGECAYSRAVREHLQQSDTHIDFETEIPFPGLPEPHSQLAVPVVRRDTLLGILYVESEEDLRFSYEDEDALLTLAEQLALLVELDQQAIVDNTPAPSPMQHSTIKQFGPPVTIRFYSANQSVFIDEEYLIKGVAGAIIWKLLKDYTETQRCEFNNRELRLDPCIGLPDISDNLEARLVLLHKRLAERCDFLRLEKTGRGRFRLHVDRPLILQTQ